MSIKTFILHPTKLYQLLPVLFAINIRPDLNAISPLYGIKLQRLVVLVSNLNPASWFLTSIPPSKPYVIPEFSFFIIITVHVDL